MDLERLTSKKERGQALNAKEFAILAGISYSMARAWFRLPGFPAFQRRVFWEDFVAWRRHPGASARKARSDDSAAGNLATVSDSPAAHLGTLPSRAAAILAQAG